MSFETEFAKGNTGTPFYHVAKYWWELGEKAAAKINNANAVDEEAERWSERLDWLHTEYGADCSGCDSGDTLDLVEVEIRQAIETAKQQAVIQCYQIASSHEFGPDAAKTIRETFGLEI